MRHLALLRFMSVEGVLNSLCAPKQVTQGNGEPENPVFESENGPTVSFFAMNLQRAGESG